MCHGGAGIWQRFGRIVVCESPDWCHENVRCAIFQDRSSRAKARRYETHLYPTPCTVRR